jgi:hypothetical protein
MFLPCLIKIFQKFLQERITTISQAASGEHFKAVMLLQTLQIQKTPPSSLSLASQK